MKRVVPSHAAAGVGLLIFVALVPWQMRTGDPPVSFAVITSLIVAGLAGWGALVLLRRSNQQ